MLMHSRMLDHLTVLINRDQPKLPAAIWDTWTDLKLLSETLGNWTVVGSKRSYSYIAQSKKETNTMSDTFIPENIWEYKSLINIKLNQKLILHVRLLRLETSDPWKMSQISNL